MTFMVPRNKGRLETSFPRLSLFDNMIDDFFMDNSLRSRTRDIFRVDVREEENSYVIEAELPGVNKEELSVALEENTLSISVKRDEKTEDEQKNYLHRERVFSSMKRSVYLAQADNAGITAKLENGELTVTVPKKQEEDTTVKIEIE